MLYVNVPNYYERRRKQLTQQNNSNTVFSITLNISEDNNNITIKNIVPETWIY